METISRMYESVLVKHESTEKLPLSLLVITRYVVLPFAWLHSFNRRDASAQYLAWASLVDPGGDGLTVGPGLTEMCNQ